MNHRQARLACLLTSASFSIMLITAVFGGCSAHVEIDSRPSAPASAPAAAPPIIVPTPGLSSKGNPVSMKVTEQCVDGVIYLVTDFGSITPKINPNKLGMDYGVTQYPFYSCP